MARMRTLRRRRDSQSEIPSRQTLPGMLVEGARKRAREIRRSGLRDAQPRRREIRLIATVGDASGEGKAKSGKRERRKRGRGERKGCYVCARACAVYIFVGNKARKSLTHRLRRPLGKVELFYDGFISTSAKPSPLTATPFHSRSQRLEKSLS